MNPNSQRPTTDHFEHWLKQTVDQEAPDLQEAILAQFARDQQAMVSPASSGSLPRWLQPLLGLAATVVLGLWGFSLLNHSSEPSLVADLQTPAILEDLLLFEQAESLDWLLYEENLVTLVSYLPQ